MTSQILQDVCERNGSVTMPDNGDHGHTGQDTIPQLPIEVVGVIIDKHVGDMQTLDQCSLVNRSWYPLARGHRYCEVTISPHSNGRPPSASLICDPTSTVLPFIQRLRVIDGVTKEDAEKSKHGIAFGGRYTPHWLDDALPEIRVSQLTGLDELGVEQFKWNEFSPASRSIFMKLIERLSFLRLLPRDDDNGLNHSAVAQILASAVSLESFNLTSPNPYASADEGEEMNIPTTAIALQSLALVNCVCCYLDTFMFFFPTTRLQKIALDGITVYDVGVIANFLASCADSLESIHLGFEPRRLKEHEPELMLVSKGGLAGATNLRTLRLSTALLYIVPILESVTSTGSLHIKLTLINLSEVTPSDAALTSLVQTLASDRLAFQPMVEILCVPFGPLQALWHQPYVEKARPILLDIMKPLREKGRLRRLYRYDIDRVTGRGVEVDF